MSRLTRFKVLFLVGLFIALTSAVVLLVPTAEAKPVYCPIECSGAGTCTCPAGTLRYGDQAPCEDWFAFCAGA